MAYHKMKIPKGELGRPSKLTEEVLEFVDAYNQGNKILALNELADLVGAINAYMKKNHPEMNLLDLHIMAEATRPLASAGLRVEGKYAGEYFGTYKGYLVGSGEQGFIHEILDSAYVEPNKFVGKKLQTLTPCFRDERLTSEYTLPYFMKLELFHMPAEEVTLGHVYDMALMAQDCMKSLEIPTKVVFDEKTIDLVTQNGVELGSYGIRTVANKQFVYGTGLAQPRAQLAVQKKEEPNV